jgi:hypothetical protein
VVRYVLFGAAVVLFATANGVEVLGMIDVVFWNVAEAVDVVNTAATVVVFNEADDVDSDMTAVDVVELT